MIRLLQEGRNQDDSPSPRGKEIMDFQNLFSIDSSDSLNLEHKATAADLGF